MPDMMQNFIEVGRNRFYCEIWPRIKDRVEAIESNLKDVKRGLHWAPRAALLIHWGYVEEETNRRVVLAITNSAINGPERHWIAPEIDI